MMREIFHGKVGFAEITAMKLSTLSRHCRTPAYVFPAILMLAVAFAQPAFASETLPKPVGAVNDFAGVLSPEDRVKMENLSREVLQKTGASLVVAVLETIGGRDPADYANRMYSAWGLGRKGEDRGVLILLAVRERRIRIETGYGLEGILPDGLVGEILDRFALPHLKKNDFGSGLYAALAAVAAVVAKSAGVELTGAPRPEARTAKRTQGDGDWLKTAILVLVAALLIGTRVGRRDFLPVLLALLFSSGGRGGGGFGGFGGGGFGGFGGGSSGGGGAGRGF